MLKFILGILIVLLTILNSGYVNASNIRMDEVVVTATRGGARKLEVPASIMVIGREEIEKSNAPSVTGLLRKVEGMEVIQQGGPGRSTSILIRGAESRHTLVLIDGVRVNSPTTGIFDLAHLSIDDIDRIEIIRGPLSTLYGSDAIGGVIQIFTKKGRRSSSTVNFESGSYGSSKEVISTQIKKDHYDLSLTASRLDTEGFSVAKAGQEKDGYQNTTVSSRIGIYPWDNASIDLTARLTEAKTELDGWNADDLNYQEQRRHGVIGLTFSSPISSVWKQTLALTNSSDRLTGIDEDTAFNQYTFDMNVMTLNWQHSLQEDDGSLFILGYELQNQHGEKRGVFDKSFKNHAVYIQEQKRVGLSTQLLAGIRWDDSTIYESAFTYRLGISHMPADTTRWYAQFGTGFRGPTLNDLFWPVSGNPNLKPEKSNGWETGIEEQLSQNLYVSITYYVNQYNNLIQWAPVDPSDPFSMWQPQNIGKATSKGIESEIVWNLSPGMRIEGNYTYNDTEDQDTHTYLLRRPLNKYNLILRLNPEGRKQLDISILHVGRRIDGGNVTLPAYSRVDLNGSYKIRETLKLYVRIENLFDKEYEEAKGYNTAGFSTYGGVRIKL